MYMNREEINNHIKIITPNLIKFANVITPDRRFAMDLISDAYSVYLIKKADYLIELVGDFSTKEATFFRKELLHDVLKEIYKLGLKNASAYKNSIEDFAQFKSFYSLDTRMRAYIYLENKLNLSQRDLKKFFGVEAHELTEIRYNAKKIILKDYQDVSEVYQ